MNPEKDTAATDEFFQNQPITPIERDDDAAEETEDNEQRPSPLHDYVRELQQEFEKQEDEGKI